MKRNEVALLLVVVGLVVMATYFLLNSLIGDSALKEVSVSSMDPISESVQDPSKAVFNDKSINPAVKVTIGNQSNQKPFTVGQ